MTKINKQTRKPSWKDKVCCKSGTWQKPDWWWTHLIALAVILQAAWTFAVAAFAVPAVRLSFFAFTNFRFERFWISVQTCLLKHIFTFNHLSKCDHRTHKLNLQPTLMALRRSVSCSRLLKQLLQLQLLQNSPLAKQSQYLKDKATLKTFQTQKNKGVKIN